MFPFDIFLIIKGSFKNNMYKYIYTYTSLYLVKTGQLDVDRGAGN